MATICGLWLAACGPGAPSSVSVRIDSDVMSEDDAILSVHLVSGNRSTRADGRLEAWIDMMGAPHGSGPCHFAADVTASQFGEGDVGAEITLPFPPGCDATVPGRVPPYEVHSTFTLRDGTVVQGDGVIYTVVSDRITYRAPAPVPEAPTAPPAPPSTMITTASCNTPVAGACEEWTLPADQLAAHQTTCSAPQSEWSLAACPLAGALGRCVMATETIYSYVTLDGAEDQCRRFGGQFTTLP